MHRGKVVQLHASLKDENEWPVSRFGLFILREWLGRPWSQSGRGGKKKNTSLPLPVIELRSFSP